MKTNTIALSALATLFITAGVAAAQTYTYPTSGGTQSAPTQTTQTAPTSQTNTPTQTSNAQNTQSPAPTSPSQRTQSVQSSSAPSPGVQSATAGIPNTGAGGNAASNLIILFSSALLVCASAIYLTRTRRSAHKMV